MTTRNFTPPSWLPESDPYMHGIWNICTFADGRKVFARREYRGYYGPLIAYDENGRTGYVDENICAVEPEYTILTNWATFDAAFERGGVTFAKEQK